MVGVRRWSIPLVRRPVTIALLAAFVFATYVAFQQLRERSASHTCAHNLRSLGFALANYESTYKCYPYPKINEVSWRMNIMPFVMSSPLHVEYKYDEPWNSPANLELHKRPLKTRDGDTFVFGVPDDFHCHHSSGIATDASFLLFVGSNAFGNPIGQRRIGELTDGTENTIVAGESISMRIHWLEPKDMDVSKMSFRINDPNAMSISSRHANGPAVLFADCSVYRISPLTPEDYVRALITINGGESVTRQSLVDAGFLLPP
jgi:hypothetical protein